MYENNFQSWAIFQRRRYLSQSVQVCNSNNGLPNVVIDLPTIATTIVIAFSHS